MTHAFENVWKGITTAMSPPVHTSHDDDEGHIKQLNRGSL